MFVNNPPIVAAVVYDGLCNFEFSCVAEVFGLPRPEFGPRWYRFLTCGAGRRPVTGQFGARLVPDADLARLRKAAIVVVPGWHDVEAPVPASLRDALRAAHANGATLVSVCSGSFVLAATGLLDDRRATTHWRYADLLQRMYPAITVDANVLYVDEGQLMTSAGSAAGLDLCLHLVRRDYGPDVANQVARRLVIAPHRDGGQAQFVERSVRNDPNDGFSRVLDRMRRELGGNQTIGEWAAMTAMSERTFLRRFRETTGTSPGQWLSQARLDHARELLESTRLPIDVIAQRSGFGSAATLRHHFRTRMGVTPTTYRARFGTKSTRVPAFKARRRPAATCA